MTAPLYLGQTNLKTTAAASEEIVLAPLSNRLDKFLAFLPKQLPDREKVRPDS